MQYTLHGPAASCSSSETQHRGLLLPLTPGSRPSPSSLLSPQVPSLDTSTTVICVLGNDIQNKSQGPVQPRQCQSGHKLAALHQCRMTTCQPDERGLSPIRQLTPLKIRAVFYSWVHHQSPAHGRCLISVCGLNQLKVTWKRQGDGGQGNVSSDLS